MYKFTNLITGKTFENESLEALKSNLRAVLGSPHFEEGSVMLVDGEQWVTYVFILKDDKEPIGRITQE